MITSFHSRNIVGIVIVIILAGIPLLSGCGSSPLTSLNSGGSSGGSSGDSSGGSSGGADSGSSDSGVTYTGTITVSGKLSVSSATSVQSLTPQDATPADGYSILATEVESGSGTREATDSQGTYSILLTKGQTYVFVIFDANNRLAGVITGNETIPAGTSGLVAKSVEYVVAGFSVNNKISASSIDGVDGTLYSAIGNAFWTGSKVAKLSDVGKLSSTMALVPVDKYAAVKGAGGGAAATGGDNGNFGNVAVGSTGKDQVGANGLPASINPDANGNGIPDVFETSSSVVTKAINSRILDASIHTSLMVQYDQTATFKNPPPDQGDGLFLLLALFPVKGKENTIASVDIIPPASYKSDIIIFPLVSEAAESLEPQPDFTQVWSNFNYKMFKYAGPTASISMPSPPAVAWYANIRPGINNVKTGDVFTFVIKYSDGTSEEIPKMVAFIYSDITRLQSYQDGDTVHQNLPTKDDAGNTIGVYGNGFPVAKGVPLKLVWSLPLNEKGTVIRGTSGLITNYYGDNGLGPKQVDFSFATAGTPATGTTATYTFTPKTVASDGTPIVQFNISIICGVSGHNTQQNIIFKFTQ